MGKPLREFTELRLRQHSTAPSRRAVAFVAQFDATMAIRAYISQMQRPSLRGGWGPVRWCLHAMLQIRGRRS